MIAVIADDFTGAAEIAGLGLRYGLKVEIESFVYTDSDADLLIIATDTRSLNEEEAYNEVLSITKQLKKVNCNWIYKKTDSVFRGHIYKELKAMLEGHDYTKSLLVPANPSLGRKIKDSIYYIDNQYLHETNFSEDPDFVLITSDVVKLIRPEEGKPVSVVKPDQAISNRGITIGEADTENDLKKWASKINNEILPAGGAGFFAALLEAQGYVENQLTAVNDYDFGENLLFVCGSAFSKGKAVFVNGTDCESKIFPMPDEVFNNMPSKQSSFENWKANIINAFEKSDYAIVEIDQPVVRDKKFSKRLRVEMARLVDDVMKKVKINELLIDGGATVYSIAEKTGINKFFPVQELAPGVVRMKIENRDDLFVTIKPGSYPWPDKLLDLPCKKN